MNYKTEIWFVKAHSKSDSGNKNLQLVVNQLSFKFSSVLGTGMIGFRAYSMILKPVGNTLGIPLGQSIDYTTTLY